MAEGQQRVILIGALGTLLLLFALYIFLVLLRVLWTRWQTYLSWWARQRVERDRAALGRHRSKRTAAKKQHHQRRDSDSDSDSRSWSSDDSRSE